MGIMGRSCEFREQGSGLGDQGGCFIMIKDTRKMENTLTQSLYANPFAFAILEDAAQGAANCCSPNSEPQAPSSFLKTPLSLSPIPRSLIPFVKMVTGMDIDSGMNWDCTITKQDGMCEVPDSRRRRGRRHARRLAEPRGAIHRRIRSLTRTVCRE